MTPKRPGWTKAGLGHSVGMTRARLSSKGGLLGVGLSPVCNSPKSVFTDGRSAGTGPDYVAM